MNYNYSGHIFNQHLLHFKQYAPILRPQSELIWPSVFLLFSLGLLALLKFRSFPKVLKIIQSVYNLQTLQQFEREEPYSFKFLALALNALFVFNLSFLLYKINVLGKFVFVEQSGLLQFIFFNLIIILMLLIKTGMNLFLAFLTGEEKLISEYLTSNTLILQASGIFLFPWLVLVEFSNFHPLIFIIGALLVLAVSTLLKWYRGFALCLLKQRVGLLQTFSYFCGLEILPVLVVVKYLIETF